LSTPDQLEPAGLIPDANLAGVDWAGAGLSVVGGTMVAQGMVHVVWLLSCFASDDLSSLLRDPWTYADIIFGIGGLIIGVGILLCRNWARKSGLCLCLAGLLSSFLWFMDESNNDVPRVMLALNTLMPPLSFIGTLYFLFGWPLTEADAGTASGEGPFENNAGRESWSASEGRAKEFIP
jgi:hypothetical protein